MHLRVLALPILAAMVFVTGCGPTAPSVKPVSESGGSNGVPDGSNSAKAHGNKTADGVLLPNKAQPRLPTIKLWLGPHELTTEIAQNASQWAAGMMFRTNMPDGEAMLFVFPQRTRAAFWMKNTYVPLSGAYIDPSGTILEIHDMKPLDETLIQAATDNILFVLEVPQGWFQRNGVGTNTMIRTERGTLLDTFFSRR